jgi:hypothetical protein
MQGADSPPRAGGVQLRARNATGAGDRIGNAGTRRPPPCSRSRSIATGEAVKAYRLACRFRICANPHYVGQAYGYIDEAQSLGAQVTLLEAGGYEHLDKQVSQVEDLIASKVDAIIIAAVSGPGRLAPWKQPPRQAFPSSTST